VITGGWVSVIVTVWLHVLVRLEQSTACHVRVISCEQGLLGVPSGFVLVTVFKTVMVTFVPQQASNAVGGSNVQAVPHCTILLGEQLMIGGLVSTIETTSVQKAALVQQSTARHVRVTIALHGSEALVTALNSETTTFVPQHASMAVGGVNRIGVPVCPH